MIRRGSEYLCNVDRGYFDNDANCAMFFGSEGMAKNAIGEMSRKGHAVELIGANVIRGSFEPIDGYNAMDTVLKIGRWKKLYSILIKDHTPAELLLLTGCQDYSSASKLPVYQKIKNLSSGFKDWDKADSYWGYNNDRGSCFKMFKKLAFYAMNEKFKQNKEKENKQ
jgi:hypothetical protein